MKILKTDSNHSVYFKENFEQEKEIDFKSLFQVKMSKKIIKLENLLDYLFQARHFFFLAVVVNI